MLAPLARRSWLPIESFARALQLVAAACGDELRSIDEWQINALVESLRGSNLCDEHGRVDYAAFVRAFYIVDTSI